MDEYTLQNLGVDAKLGGEVVLDGETFVLCGILEGAVEKLSYMQVFVSEQVDYGMNGLFLYVKFKENRPVYQQMDALIRKFQIDGDDVRRNNDLVYYVGGESTESFLKVAWGSLLDENLGLPYLYAYCNDGGG